MYYQQKMSTLSVSLLNPIKTIAKSPLITIILILAPMVSMFAITLFCMYGISTITINEYEYTIQAYRNILLSPIYVITALTWIAGFAGLVAVYFKLKSILRLSSYIYAAIAYWAIINILILIFTAWSYMTISTIGHIFLWSSLTTVIWLYSSAVMNVYGEDISSTYDIV